MRTSFAALALMGVLFSGLSFAMSLPINRPHKEVQQTESSSAETLATSSSVTGVPQSSALLARPH